MKLTKQQVKLHDEALARLKQDALNDDDRDFVFEHYHPGATNNLTAGAIFFTPAGVAIEAAVMHGGGGRVIDLCAGIGILGRTLLQHSRSISELVCVEINAEFVEIGRKLVPEATWIHGSAFVEVSKLGVFDSGISNPPFGNIKSDSTSKFARTAHMAVAELLLLHTREGAVMIIPDGDHSQADRSCPMPSAHYERFCAMYPLSSLEPCGTDISIYQKEWKGTSPKLAVVNLSTDGSKNPYLVGADITEETAVDTEELSIPADLQPLLL